MESISFYCRISNPCHDFLAQTFGSVRSGAAFILNAMPFWLASTWEEITSSGRLTPDVLIAILNRSRHEQRITLNFSGEVLVRNSGVALSSLSWFDRVAAEYWLLQQLGPEDIAIEISPDVGPLSRRIGIELHKEAADVAGSFTTTGGNTDSGASFLLNSFLLWHQAIISSLPQNYLNLCSAVLRYESCSQPQLSGRILQDRLARLGGPELPIFTLACIEISNMEKRKQKKTVQASPKLTASVGDAFRELFPNVNAGFGYVLSSFPRMYQQSLDTEVLNVFCTEELDELYGAAKAAGVDLANPQSAGDGILLAARQSSGELAGKVDRLSPFARLCLEVFLQNEWIKDA